MANIKAETKNVVYLMLELNEREAYILASMVQNPFDEDETKEASDLRLMIFNALKSKQTLTRSL